MRRRFTFRYGFLDPIKELNKIQKLALNRPDLRFTERYCPFNFNYALDRGLIEPSGKYFSKQLRDGGITEQEFQFKL